MNKIDWGSLLLTFLIFVYFWWAAQVSFDFSIIGTFNLVMHEAGHWIFGIFGQFVGMLGGSLMQVLVPLVFAVAFFIQRQPLGVVFCLMWAGQSVIEVSVYAGDAVARQLPLLGGEAVIHDWYWLLSELGLLEQTALVAGLLAFVGWSLLLLGLLYGLLHAVRRA